MVPAPLSNNLIDLARAQSIAIAAGATTVPMDSKTLKLARVTADPTGYWRAEGNAITASDMAFDSVTLTAKVLACLVPVTVELLEDAVGADQVIAGAIGKALALELDRVVFEGSGEGAEPAGILGGTNVETVATGADGAALGVGIL